MFKKFMTTIMVMAAGIIILIGIIIRSSMTTIELVSHTSLAGELKVGAGKIVSEVSELRDLVSYAYITSDPDLIEINLKNADVLSKKISDSFLKLSDPTYQELFTDITSESSGSFNDLVEEAQSSYQEAYRISLTALTNRKKISESQIKLEKQKKKLSKAFRKSDDFASLSPKGYKYLRRAVFTALFSESVKDLNFAGRALLERAQKSFANGKVPVGKQDKIKSLIKSVEEVIGRSIYINASNSDFDLFNENVKKLMTSMSNIDKLVNLSLVRAQQRLSDNVQNDLFVIPSLGVITILVGVAISILLAKKTVNGINGILIKLLGSSHRINETAVESHHVSTVLDRNTESQAAAVQQTSAATREISETIEKNVAVVVDSARLSAHSEQESQHGYQIVTQMTSAMGEIKASNEDINTEMENSGRNMKEIIHIFQLIAEKIAVINDIVFQTKLLSFNASVEAARAGEHGKGFSVVAEEVGNLATLSGNSAREINQLLHENTEKVDRIMKDSIATIGKAVTASKGKIENGLSIATKNREILERISDNETKLSAQLKQIEISAAEELSGVRNIADAMETIDTSTNESSHISKAILKTSKELGKEVATMTAGIRSLESLVSGQGITDKKPIRIPKIGRKKDNSDPKQPPIKLAG